MLFSQQSLSHSMHMVGQMAWAAWLSQPIPDVEESPFPGFVLPNDTNNSQSVLGVKPGDSGVFIGYQVDAFNSTWVMEHFVA